MKPRMNADGADKADIAGVAVASIDTPRSATLIPYAFIRVHPRFRLLCSSTRARRHFASSHRQTQRLIHRSVRYNRAMASHPQRCY